jgi:hypothetical protein
VIYVATKSTLLQWYFMWQTTLNLNVFTPLIIRFRLWMGITILTNFSLYSSTFCDLFYNINEIIQVLEVKESFIFCLSVNIYSDNPLSSMVCQQHDHSQ